MEQQRLEVLGLSDTEETIYQLLLERRADAVEIAAAAGLSASRTAAVLRELERKGLLTRSGSRHATFVPADPEVAMRLLIMRHHDRLVQASTFIDELAARYRASARQSGSTELVEVVAGRDASYRRAEELMAGAQNEILGVSGTATPDEDFIQMKLGLMGRGVKIRAIYDPSITRDPAFMTFVERTAAAGEKTRLMHDPVAKFLVIDQRVGWVPWDLNESRLGHDPGILLVHHSSLIEMLCHLFHVLWERATPLRFGDDEAVADLEPSGLTRDDRRLLALLASGLVDDAIGGHLGVTRRTIEHRVSRLKDALGASSRFQMAVLACERGWIEATGAAPPSNGAHDASHTGALVG